MEVIHAALRNINRAAVVAGGTTHRYSDIIRDALRAASMLQNATPSPPRDGTPPFPSVEAFSQPRIGILCDPGPEYVSATIGTWLRRGISVPLCLSHPDTELSYVLQDSGAAAVLATPPNIDRAHRIAEPFGAQVHALEASAPTSEYSLEYKLDDFLQRATKGLLDAVTPSDGSILVYTSGTTGRPKGALHTHASLGAQISTLCDAWEWSLLDRILHTLPLHHVHGLINALLCPLNVGAAVEFLPKFSPTAFWVHLKRKDAPITVFMGVPTMYSFLLDSLATMPDAEQKRAAAAAAGLRLAVSGSAACPLPLMHRWRDLTGHTLLERYGMTETGMLLGNPLHGERRPGTVGLPFTGVEARVHPSTGELSVRSAQLFSGYWGLKKATEASFDSEGWFHTGDTAEIDPTSGYFKLLGRTSVDIIKVGGYKVSALDVESKLLEHPAILECAVVGLPDDAYGERLAAIVAVRGDESLELKELQEWAAERMAKYQVPKELKIVTALPRNAMGKVNKKALRAEIYPEAFSQLNPGQGSAGAAA